MTAGRPTTRGSRLRRLGFIAGVAGVALLCGLIFDQLYRTHAPAGSPILSGPQAQEPSAWGPGPKAAPAAAPRPIARERQPWQASKDDTPVPPHHTPAWAVNPPRPDPQEAPPAPPQEPPSAPDYRPPMHSPNGVNGNRPARPVPGLE
ncbi:MAG TPA: hypothetical protein VGQ83_40350 [Polyangia bacterium]